MSQGPPPANSFNAFTVNTTFVPNPGADEVVPAVAPPPQPQGGAWAPATQGAWAPAPPPHVRASYQPAGQAQPANLAFTTSTAQPFVSGNMARQEEQIALVAPNTHSDLPSSSNTMPGEGEAQQRLAEESAKYAFYNPRRYRPYFNVDTKDVAWRVGNSLIGLFRATFIETTMKSPDLYGPFWVATTLVLMTAITGNFASYIDYRSQQKATSNSPSPPPAPAKSKSNDMYDNQWFTDYTKLSASAGIFYGYIFVIGLLLFFLVKWFKGELRLVNVWCVYGYAMTIYIPVCMACIVPLEWLRWVLVMTATALSAGFLVRNFKNTIFEAAPARAMLICLLIFLLHFGLGLALKLYFFSYS